MHSSLSQESSFAAIGSGISVAFGHRLRSLRERGGLKPMELARRLGISSMHLEDLEMGNKEADLLLLDSVSQTLRLSLSDLLTGL